MIWGVLVVAALLTACASGGHARAAGPAGLTRTLVPAPGPPVSIDVPPDADLAAAVEQAPPSSTIRVAAGVHRLSRPVVPRDGQTIAGAPGAVVSGATVLGAWQRAGATWSARAPTGLDAQASGQTQPDWETSTLPYDLYVDGALLRRVASPGDVKPTTWYLDASAGQVVVGADPAGRLIELSTVAAAFEGDAQQVTLDGLTIEKFATPAQQGMVHAPDGRSWTVTGSEIRFSHAAGVLVGSGSTVSDNSIHDNGQVGVKTWSAENVLIRGNTIRANNTLHFDPFWEAGGIKVTNSRDVRIVSNDISGNGGFGAWADYSGTGIAYEQNTIRGNSLAGIQHEASFAATITGNTIVDNGAAAAEDSPFAGSGVYVYDSSDVDIANNEIARNRCGVVALVRDRGTATESLQPVGSRLEVRNLSVHDNTVEMASGYSGLIVDPRSDSFPFTTMDTGTARSYFTDANNVWDRNTYRGTGFGESPSTTLTDADRRFVWGIPLGGGDTTAWTTRRYVGRTAWQGFGQDRDSSFDVAP